MLEEPQSSPSRWMRVQQAVQYAGVSKHFIKELLRKREIRTIKAGKHFLIDVLDLDKYFEKLQEQQHASSGNGEVGAGG